MGRVYVAGSINMDVVATAERHPNPGETVKGKAVLYFPGGKGANQAVAAVRLGATTTLIGRLGKDTAGKQLKAFLVSQRIDLGYVVEASEAPTGTAIITVAGGENTIVVIPGANEDLTPEDVSIAPLLKGDVAVSQFEIPLPAISSFFKRARMAGATTLLNPAPAMKFNRELLDLVDVLVLNETELGLLAGIDLKSDEAAHITETARRIQASKDQVICVTLGRRGVLAIVGDEPLIIPGRIVPAVDSTGAGDCFVGALAAQLADGAPFRDALSFANTAASICVQRMGAAPSMPTAEEVGTALAAARQT
ncbi:MAG: ribokinase [Bradyrhizobium sp.]|uniref:ribokinase n=1 Tax=Bradyrhizobium sp. TaxID=376 RepID=UPI0025C6B9B3|nr:ribokinase [Bradyrhizobium sp.]MBI5263737.1 ribokinase [Bradyrhizobium sp.]